MINIDLSVYCSISDYSRFVTFRVINVLDNYDFLKERKGEEQEALEQINNLLY